MDINSLLSPSDSPVPHAPTSTTPARSLAGTSSRRPSVLSADEDRRRSELASRLSGNPFDFTAHTDLINLLHKGLIDHLELGREPHSFELLGDLRKARESLDKIIAVGEELWVDWLNDENLLARTTDDRLALMELFHRAVMEEPNSALLWRLYGNYMYYLWSASHDINGTEAKGWSDMDKTVGREVFQWAPMIEVWEQGVVSTQGRLNDSNLVWDRYIEILMLGQGGPLSPQLIAGIREKFDERLRKPHATWDQTFQMFSSFISTHESGSYEEIMARKSKESAQAKKVYAMRQDFEFKIQQAVEKMDKETEWNAYLAYLDWELRKKGVYSGSLINGLYERATVRFPTDATLWTDYIEFIIENPIKEIPSLEITLRATRHCPWSGELWSHRMMAMEAAGKSFQEIEAVKHAATVSGLLDVSSLEELLKVYIAWCGCLRRRAFLPGARDEDHDVAEVGIRSALEETRASGVRRYGKEYHGDPQYRLERIHIKFLTQSGNIDTARECWQELVAQRGDSYDFWYRFYIWEMVVWSKLAFASPKGTEFKNIAPSTATKVLYLGLQRLDTIDWPEPLVQMFLNHCEQHETIQEYRKAVISARKATKKVAKRREAEAAAWKQQQELESAQKVEGVELNGGKRKRGDEVPGDLEDKSAKKPRQDDPPNYAAAAEDMPMTDAGQPPKRDREHTALVARNIPAGASESRIKQFFRDCGTIKSMHVSTDDNTNTQSAFIEFGSHADVLFAQSKVTKPFDGITLDIELSTGCIVWVTNYPPVADEAYIRNLFAECGPIIDVRFPSLKANTFRRFCYVQFAMPEAAQRATELEGRVLDGGCRLQARISDPGRKEERHGPQAEGREVYVKDVDFALGEEDLERVFAEWGEVERIRIPRGHGGKSKGVGFVVYATREMAERAVEGVQGRRVGRRNLHAEISRMKSKRTATTVKGEGDGSRGARSLSPDSIIALSVSAAAVENGDGAHSPGMPVPYPSRAAHNNDEHESNARHRARTIALLNVPDTINSAQLEKFVEDNVGPIAKLVLRPDHAGAVVEFVDERSVGVARLKFAGGAEIGTGVVEVGSVDKLERSWPAKGGAGRGGMKGAKSGEKEKETGSGRGLGSGLVARPRGGGAVGRRGGLGRKMVVGTSVAKGGEEGGMLDGEKKGRSNADFRTLLNKGKE